MRIEYQDAITRGLRDPDNLTLGLARKTRPTYDFRDHLVSRYAWAIPNAAAIRLLVDLSPIIELGAGTGYWAYLIRKAGGRVTAYDSHPVHAKHLGENRYHGVQSSWLPVRTGGAEALGGRRHHTLFLCWPPGNPRETLAYQALKAYQGRRIVYVGEPTGGVTATRGFFRSLHAGFTCVHRLDLPQWPGCKDDLTVWERRT